MHSWWRKTRSYPLRHVPVPSPGSAYHLRRDVFLFVSSVYLSMVPNLIAYVFSFSLAALLLWFLLMYQKVQVSLLICPSTSSSIVVSVLASRLAALAISIVSGPFKRLLSDNDSMLG